MLVFPTPTGNLIRFPPIITLFPPTVYILCLEYNCLQGKVTNGLFLQAIFVFFGIFILQRVQGKIFFLDNAKAA